MSKYLIDKPRAFARKRFYVSHTTVDRRRRHEPVRLNPLPPVTDEEATFVTRAALWMAVLAITPWILFYILNSLHPNFLLISIAPN